jgi:predicted nuclease of predicted toxin-antitoxin system
VKFKLDENFGLRGKQLLVQRGHDVKTVHEQGLSGATDEALFWTCAEEKRALITLDRGFGHVLRFPPERSAGIAVIEHPSPLSTAALLERLQDFLSLLETNVFEGKLWVVEPGRIRIHQDR